MLKEPLGRSGVFLFSTVDSQSAHWEPLINFGQYAVCSQTLWILF